MAPRTNIENRPQMTSELYTRGLDFWQKLFWIWTVHLPMKYGSIYLVI